MGWLDRLFSSRDGSKETSKAPYAESEQPWRKILSKTGLRPGFEWDALRKQKAVAKEVVTALFTEAAPTFGAGRVVAQDDDDRIELRGSYSGAPFRFGIWMPFGSMEPIEMQGDFTARELNLLRDLSKIPTAASPADPWSADDEQRVFVAKGVFFKSDAASVQRQLATWQSLAREAQARVLTDMERLDLWNLGVIGHPAAGVILGANAKLSDLQDPIAFMQACAELMAAHISALKNAIPASESQPSGRDLAPAAVQVPTVCRYCGTRFIVAVGECNCPNCGAADMA